MQRDNHGSGIDPRQYVGPYRMDKTLGKGQTGKFYYIQIYYDFIILRCIKGRLSFNRLLTANLFICICVPTAKNKIKQVW